MSIVSLVRKGQCGDKVAVSEILRRYRNLMLKYSFIEGQTEDEREDFIQFLTICLIEAIYQFDFDYSSKVNKKFFFERLSF